jgi:NADH-ubiquinone oxidoreductase chain 5
MGGQTTKILDKGSIELLGPFGLEKLLIKISKIISSLNTGVVTNYALFILIGFIAYTSLYYSFLIPGLDSEAQNLDLSSLVLLFAISILTLYNTKNKNNGE